jgi:hypothetical protein
MRMRSERSRRGPEIVLFLGAGASAPFGPPVTRAFRNTITTTLHNEVYNRINEAPGVEDAEHVFRIVEDLLKATRSPACKYVMERFMSREAFVPSRQATNKRNRQSVPTEIAEIPPNQDEIFREAFTSRYEELNGELERLRSELERLIFSEYNVKMEAVTKIGEFYRGLIPRFIAQAGSHELPVFTTNYDSVVETAVAALSGCVLVDGFDTDGFFDPREWNKKSQQACVKLFKLHGSLSYREWRDGRIQKVVTEESVTTDSRYRRNRLIYMGLDEYPREEPFRSAHEFLQSYLMNAKHCVVIGFTFRDTEIKDIFDRSMEANEKLRLTILDPDGRKIADEKFSQIRNRVKALPQKWGGILALRELFGVLAGSVSAPRSARTRNK